MGSGRHEIDVEGGDPNFRKRSGSGKGYNIGPMHPPPEQTAQRERQRRRCVFLIPLFVLAFIGVLVVTMYYNNCPEHEDELGSYGRCIIRFFHRFSFQPWKENPLLGPAQPALIKLGGLESYRVVKRHQAWRLVSCIWLHAGVFHLLANSIGLLLVGVRLEREFGFLKIGIVYLLSGIGGSLVSALFLRNDTVSVGASGALFGLLGATLAELLTNWTIYSNKCLAMSSLLVIVLVNLGLGLMPYVDNFAHIGGFVSGFLLGFVFLVKPQYGWVNLRKMPEGYREDEMPVRSKHTCSQYVMFVVAAILLVLGYAAAAISLFENVNVRKKCGWCHYLNCVPTSLWKCPAYE